MARHLTDGELEILDAEPGPCPTWGRGPEVRDCPDCDTPAADWQDDYRWDLGPAAEPVGPTLLDESWEVGYQAGRESAEAELRDLAMQVARLESALAEARAEVLAADR